MHPPPSPSEHRSGTSIVEVLIAAAILGIGIGAVAQLLPLSVRAIARAGERSRIHQAAQEKAEGLQALRWDDPALDAETDLADTVAFETRASATGRVRQVHARRWRIAPSKEPETKEIVVAVEGQDLGQGRGYLGRRQTGVLAVLRVRPGGVTVRRN